VSSLDSAGQPQRLLDPFGAIALIVGIVIGAGIFKTPALVASLTNDMGWTLLVWAAGALISVVGALCYAELCSAYPHAGGDYHFLHRAFGRHVAFLYGWARATVINPGAMALLAYVFGDYFSQVLSLGEYSSAIWALSIVLLLTAVNVIGIRTSSRIQTGLVVLEVVGLLAVVVAGFSVDAPAAEARLFFSSVPAASQFGLALVFVLLTFGGWNEAAYISAELRGGARSIVRVIVISMLVLTAVYMLVNMALLHALGLQGLAQSSTAASDVLGRAWGPWAEKALGLFVAIAALTSINATMVVGARANYAVGLDWPSLRQFGQWQGSSGSPTRAYVLQAGISVGLIVLGMREADGFAAMVEFTAPMFWSFLLLVGLALLWLRRSDPLAARPFRVPLYPFTPLVFCAACGSLAYASVVYAVSQNAIHVSFWLLASGVLALLVLCWRESVQNEAVVAAATAER
jgi:APA family basic amino acid/polyamine antiporter